MAYPSDWDNYNINEDDRMDYMGSSEFPDTPNFSTQPSQPSQPSSSRKKKTTSVMPSRKLWTAVEDVRLCQSWVNVSTDKIVGNEQTAGGFWKRVAENYYDNLPEGWIDNRNSENIRHHFGDLSARIKQFQALLNFELRKNQSGRNEADLIKAAEENYLTTTNKVFKDHLAFDILKDQPKWHVKVGLLQPKKKQKSNESVSRNTDYDVDIDEDIHEASVTDKPVRPTGRKAAKNAARGGSSHGASSDPALVGFLENYQEKTYALKESSRVSMERMAGAAEQAAAASAARARAEQDAADIRIMEMNPNDPELTETRRNWILFKQTEIFNKLTNAGRN